jgi:hypothetical protein
MLDRLAQGWQDGAELPHPVVLVMILLLAPRVVVPVLAAPGRVGAGSLDVALRIWLPDRTGLKRRD